LPPLGASKKPHVCTHGNEARSNRGNAGTRVRVKESQSESESQSQSQSNFIGEDSQSFANPSMESRIGFVKNKSFLVDV